MTHPYPRRAFPNILLALLTCLTAACTESPSEKADMATLSVEVTYRERMALPPGATLRVTMEDVSRMDTAATVITEITRQDPGAPPYSVQLSYDPLQIDARHRYAVRATIRAGDQLMFTTTDHVDALPPGVSGPVRLTLRRTAAPTAEAAAPLAGTRWTLDALGAEVVATGENAPHPTLEFGAEDGQASGFAGCNRFTGSYALGDRDELSFGRLASTRRACSSGMELEQRFLTALEAVRHRRIEGRSLQLLDQQGQVLARFTAQ